MPTVVAKQVHRLAAVVLTISMLAGIGIVQASENTVPLGVNQAVGALAYAWQTKTLYKSDGKALYSSDDGGRQWAKMPLAALAHGSLITAVAVTAVGQGTLYVAGPGLGVLRSVDAGKRWVSVSRGLPRRDVIALATRSTAPDTVYAVVKGKGIYRSENGGTLWRLMGKGPPAEIRQIIHTNMAGSMQTGWLFAATDKGVYRSMDCFCGFRNAGNLPGPVGAVAYDPKQPKELYAAVGERVFNSANGGQQWHPVGSPGARVTGLTYSPAGVLYALLAGGRVMRSNDNGMHWK
ncbi:MAG TPA: YCF48-related protein [Stellaceae bacterium]|nr:YCF48-related protein [Stellaceae bacterium]